MKHIAKDLGLDWDAVLEVAGVSRSTAWRLDKLNVSDATMRRLWDVLNEESERRTASGSTQIPTALLEAWDNAGRHLLIADRQLFDHVVELVTNYVNTVRRGASIAHDIVDTIEGSIALLEHEREMQSTTRHLIEQYEKCDSEARLAELKVERGRAWPTLLEADRKDIADAAVAAKARIDAAALARVGRTGETTVPKGSRPPRKGRKIG